MFDKKSLGNKKKTRLKRVTSICCWFLKGCELTRWCFSKPIQLEANARTKSPESALNDKSTDSTLLWNFTSTGDFNSNWYIVAYTLSYNCSPVDSVSQSSLREWLLLSQSISFGPLPLSVHDVLTKLLKETSELPYRRGLESFSCNIMT